MNDSGPGVTEADTLGDTDIEIEILLVALREAVAYCLIATLALFVMLTVMATMTLMGYWMPMLTLMLMHSWTQLR